MACKPISSSRPREPAHASALVFRPPIVKILGNSGLPVVVIEAFVQEYQCFEEKATNFTLGKRVSSPQREKQTGKFEPKTHVVLMQDMQQRPRTGRGESSFPFLKEVKLAGRSHLRQELVRVRVPFRVHECRLPLARQLFYACRSDGKGRTWQLLCRSKTLEKIEICSFRTLELLQCPQRTTARLRCPCWTAKAKLLGRLNLESKHIRGMDFLAEIGEMRIGRDARGSVRTDLDEHGSDGKSAPPETRPPRGVHELGTDERRHAVWEYAHVQTRPITAIRSENACGRVCTWRIRSWWLERSS